MITEAITNPPTAITAGAGTVVTNMFIATLPVAINVIMAIYLIVVVCHKCWQFYNEIKDRRAGGK